MSEKRYKSSKPAVLFGENNVTRVGYIENYIFACEIKGEGHVAYSKPRRPKYHLVIIILDGTMSLVINGERLSFGKDTYVNLPTWSDIYEISYDADFHAMATATDKGVVQDIFQNRNPFPPDFRFTIDHGIGGSLMERRDIETLHKDISNMISSLSNKDHHFAEEINYAYFYILLTDMADMMWRTYGKGAPSRNPDMKRSDTIMKDLAMLLTQHIRKETSVEFYAESLCISKQYLSLIVKEKTRVTIGKIISSMRAEEASRLLRDPGLTLQQIAEMLSFSDQSSFGKFFKKQTGISPLKYRQKLRKTLLTLRQ
jgi:AraC-like DNA-binding protein